MEVIKNQKLPFVGITSPEGEVALIVEDKVLSPEELEQCPAETVLEAAAQTWAVVAEARAILNRKNELGKPTPEPSVLRILVSAGKINGLLRSLLPKPNHNGCAISEWGWKDLCLSQAVRHSKSHRNAACSLIVLAIYKLKAARYAI